MNSLVTSAIASFDIEASAPTFLLRHVYPNTMEFIHRDRSTPYDYWLSQHGRGQESVVPAL